MYDDVGRVSADLVITGVSDGPQDVSDALGLAPHFSCRKGDGILNPRGVAVGTRRYNHWSYGSSPSVVSKDVNEHVRALANVFLPRADVVKMLAKNNEVFCWIVWESSRLVGGGPILSARSCSAIATLGIELHFDIYCLEEHAEAP